jgi:hypothetical protein
MMIRILSGIGGWRSGGKLKTSKYGQKLKKI